MSGGQLLGVSVLEITTDQTGLEAGLASAKAKTGAVSKEMQASMDHAGRSSADAAVKLKSYQLAVQAAEVRVNSLSRSVAAGRGDQDRLNASLQLAQGRLQLAQARLESYTAKSMALARETQSLAAATGISSRAFADLAGHMGPVGRTLDDLTTRSRLYRHHGVDYVAAGLIGLEAGFLALSVRGALHFEELGKKVQQQTGLTGKALDGLMETIRKVAATSAFDINHIADAAVVLRQEFGFTDKQIATSANQMIEFAKATGQDVRPQMQQLARIMTDFHQPLGKVVGLTDKLVAIWQATQQPIDQMTGALDKFGPKLQALGLNLNDSVRLLGLFSASGIKADQMGRGLATALTNVTKATTGGPEKLKAYGLAVEQAQLRVDKLSGKAGGGGQHVLSAEVDLANRRLDDAVKKYGAYSTQAEAARIHVDKLQSSTKGSASSQHSANTELDIAQGKLGLAKDKYDALNRSLAVAKHAHGDVASVVRGEIEQIVHAHSRQEALNLAIGDFGKSLGPAMARAYYNNEEALKKVDAAMHKVGATQGLYNADAATAAGNVGKLKSAFNDLQIEVGSKLVPALTAAAHWTAGAIHDVDEFYKRHKDLLQIAGGITAISAAMTLLGRHTPIGRVLQKLLGDKAPGLSNFLTGGGSGIVGTKGGVAPGSLANPIAVVTEFGGKGGPGASGLSKEAQAAEKDASKLSRTMSGLGKLAKSLPVIATVYTAGELLGLHPSRTISHAATQGAANASNTFHAVTAGHVGAVPLDFAMRPVTGVKGPLPHQSSAWETAAFGRLGPTAVGRPGGPSVGQGPSLSAMTLEAERAKMAMANLDKTSATTFANIALMARRAGNTKFAFADSMLSELLKAGGSTKRVVGDMLSQLHRLPPSARSDAANAMLQMAGQLEQKGALPKGSTARLRDAIVQNFRGMRVKSLEETTNLVTGITTSMKTGAAGVVTQALNMGTGVFTNVKNMHTKSQTEFKGFATDAGNVFTQLGSLLDTKAKDTAAKVIGHHQDMHRKSAAETAMLAVEGSANMDKLAGGINSAMVKGTQSAGTGTKLITDELNKALKGLGAKTIPSVVAVGVGSLTSIIGKSRGGFVPAASGALFQLGREGEGGHDSIPLNVGGVPVVAAPGEKVAFLTRHQQAYLDHKLAGDGGLEGMFSKVNRPNYMATGGVLNSTSAGASVAANPGRTVTASTFGGPGDPGTGSTGYRGDNLYSKPDSFAELNMGSALGGLPYMAPVNVTAHGHTNTLFKRDIGLGGGGIGGAPRAIDLWFQAAQALGVSGLELVQVASGSGFPLNIVGGAAGAAAVTVPQLSEPKVKGFGPVHDMVLAGLKKYRDQAQTYLQAHAPMVTVGGAGGPGTMAAAPGSPPAVVQAAMMAAANEIIGRPYIWGGGHGGFGLDAGYDCSGAVSFLLHAGGFLNSPLVAADLMSFGDPGPGKFITVGANSGHTMISFFGKMLEAAHTGTNVRWDSGWSEAFTFRHPPGFSEGGMLAMPGRKGDPGQSDPASLLKQAPWLKNDMRFLRYRDAYKRAGNKHPTWFKRGGLLRFDTGGETADGPSTTGTTSPAPTTSTAKANAKAKAKAKPKVVPINLPKLKGAPGDSANRIAQINTINNSLSQLGAWQSYITSLHGTAVGEVDPRTGKAKSVAQRLGEIGAPGNLDLNTELGIDDVWLNKLLEEQALASEVTNALYKKHPKAHVLKKTIAQPELTIQNKDWDDFKKKYPKLVKSFQVAAADPSEGDSGTTDAKVSHQFLSRLRKMFKGKLPQGFAIDRVDPDDEKLRPWNPRKSYVENLASEFTHYTQRATNMTAIIDYLTKKKELLTPEKDEGTMKVHKRYDKLRDQWKTRRLNTPGDVNTLGVQEKEALTGVERNLIDSISHAKAGGFAGDLKAWKAARGLEVGMLRDEFSIRRKAVDDSLKSGKALHATVPGQLTIDEAAQLSTIKKDFTDKKFALGDVIDGEKFHLRFAQAVLKRDGGTYNALFGSGGTVEQLGNYLDPMGQLSIDILTKRNSDIPTLLNEISTLKGTTGANDPAMLDLLRQQNQQLELALSVSQTQYKTLADLPAFGGSFAQGGVVPGRPGEPRTIIAHGGEKVTPEGQDPSRVVVKVEDHRTRVWVDDVEQIVQQVTRRDTRRSMAGLPGRGGG